MRFDEDEEQFFINENFSKNGQVDYTEDNLRDFVRGIVSGLNYSKNIFICYYYYHSVHINGIIHRDIKPDNILFDKDNVCKISNFNFNNNFS